MTNQTQFLTLPNGLTIHLKEIHTAPIISTWIWYKVGSRNEIFGKTGISHWVEHMQFKGTDKFPSGYLDREISKTGGIWNAMTYLDWTTYFTTLPAYAANISLEMEADRIVNSRFDVDEVERERTVIISEREGNENQPHFLLGEAVQDAAFARHPYKYEVIGLKDDLREITAEDLKSHYQIYYQPGNAVLAIAGDFDSETMLGKIEEHFNQIPQGSSERPEIQQEPPLDGEKRVHVTGPGETSYVQIAYHAPSASAPDFLTLTVLDSLLTGPSSLNMFGSGGTSNKTSRLYRALVEAEISVSCHGALQATRDPYLYGINLTVHPEHAPEEILEAVDAEIANLLETPVTQVEIDRAIKQAKALFAYSSENITNQAFWLGYSEMFDHYDWFENYVDNLSRVSPKQVMETARTYLSPDNRVVGFYTPQES
ncbi:MAG: pitrilysin family protein [Brevefilum sp.]|nr:pitrilysin family protein [Brevefilum sp.]MDT8380659.1 pitrilysin family protein [Brevefilum sp.]MDW7753541.1 pitrilysin family protein [Brevefilum sp.]